LHCSLEAGTPVDPSLAVDLQAATCDLTQLEGALASVRADMLAAERRFAPQWKRLPKSRRGSARNLLHYLALRRRDVRSLQRQLADRGLSSLGRAESAVLPAVEAVLSLVRPLEDPHAPVPHAAGMVGARGYELLERHTRELLGPEPDGRHVRVMVTMPLDAAHDYELVRDLLASGMDCMRINAAHDDAGSWDRMLAHLVGRDTSSAGPAGC
jgi:pyruvate kinase